MKKQRKIKGQIALEFMLIMSITMAMLFPIMSLFSDFVSESTKEVINIQIDYLGRSMIETAEQMFYYGKGSMIIVEYKFPERVTKMKINKLENDDKKYYEITFTIELPGGEISKAFQSTIPITTNYENDLFPARSHTSGIKRFRIENIGSAVQINYIETK